MDHQTLKTSTAVCRKWNQIISSSREPMSKLTLMISYENYDPENLVPKLTRPYQSVTLEEIVHISKKALAELKKIGQSVKEVNINDCILRDREFIQLCRCFPNLETLEIRWCSLGADWWNIKRTTARPAELKKLKSLSIWGDGWMLENIKCSQLEILSLNRFYVESQRSLVRFLNAQASLKFLGLSDIVDVFTMQNQRDMEELNLKFDLEEISLFNLRFADEKQLLKLLENARNVRTASIGYDVPPVVAREVIKQCHNLQNLFFDADLVSNSINFDMLSRMPSLLELKVCGMLRAPLETLISFLSLFPNVVHLDLISLEGNQQNDKRLWESLSQNMKKLQSLEINRLNIFNLVVIEHPMLETLAIDHIGYTNQVGWEIFGKKNQKIKTFMIRTTPVQVSLK